MPPASMLQVVQIIGVGVAAGLASLPHCAVMCGPVCAHLGRAPLAGASLRYQLGRTLGYAFAGMVAARFGLVLSDFLPRAAAGRALGLTAGAACVLLALRLFRGEERRPPVVRLHVLARGRRRLAPFWSLLPRDPVALGGLSALLPCGSLYGALILAASTASGLHGAILMAAFALASAPAILASPWLARVLLRLRSPILRRGVAVSLMLVAIALAMPPQGRAAITGAHEPDEAPCH